MLRNALMLKHNTQKNQANSQLMQTKLGKKVVAALASHFRMIQNSGQKVDILMHHKRGDVAGNTGVNGTSGAGG